MSVIYISHIDDQESWNKIHKMLEDNGDEVVNGYIDLKNKENRPIDYMGNVIENLLQSDCIYMMSDKISKLGQLEVQIAEYLGLEQC